MRLAMRVGGGVAVAAALLGVSAPGAGAAGPEKVPFSGGGSVIDTDLCGFPIDISFEWSGFDLLFFDENGDLVRIQSHARETDTVSANGVTLVGDPYTFNANIRFSDGEVVDYDVSGQLSKVRLPDGSLFMGAGRTDFLARTSEFIFTPDNGAAKNVDAFCDALSG
jgi:hypothetical protein